MAELTKVVHVMRRMVPEMWGGTEASVFNTSCELERQGVESRVHCTSMCANPGPGTVGPIRIFRHAYVFPWFGLSEPSRQMLRLKGGSPLSLPLFLALLREEKVSLIHTHVQHRLGGMARTAARIRRIPYAVSLHGGHFTLPQDQIDQMSRPFAGRIEWGRIFGLLFGSRRVLRDADAIICVGKSEYDEVRRRFPQKPVYYVPNGVDTHRFSSADGTLFRETQGIDPSERVVLCVSRIDPQKNQLGLVRAFARFRESHDGYRLVLLGPVSVTGYRDRIMAEINRLGLSDRVSLIEGYAPGDPLLPSAYKAADLFVLPSVHEPFGIVVLEAWAAGVPVVASRTGGIPGFAVDRETALLVRPGDEAALCDAMEELTQQPELAAGLAANAGRVVAEQYDWKQVTARLKEVYEQMVRNG